MPKTRAPLQTLAEAKYLRQLIDTGARVEIKLTDNEILSGKIEFYDEHFLRLTREDAPNLFIYKHDVKYLYEVPDKPAE